jgi:PAT family beta-lactamase induction signal transducer AmpG
MNLLAQPKIPKPKPLTRNPWSWIPTLYLAEGLPYVVVMTVTVIMYKGLGLSNTDIALYTSWLYLPWVVKPLWSPVVDILKTRRRWIWLMQLLIGGGLAGVALTIPTSNFLQYTLAFLWLLAFSSATHDIAADGFYMLATTEKEQAFFVGIRSTFYRISMISGQGLLVILAGLIQSRTGNIPLSCSSTFTVLATLFLLFGTYHKLILPYPAPDRPGTADTLRAFLKEFFRTFGAFFRKERIGILILFLLFYRFAEAQLVKLVAPFLLDSRDFCGLGLTTSKVGDV